MFSIKTWSFKSIILSPFQPVHFNLYYFCLKKREWVAYYWIALNVSIFLSFKTLIRSWIFVYSALFTWILECFDQRALRTLLCTVLKDLIKKIEYANVLSQSC